VRFCVHDRRPRGVAAAVPLRITPAFNEGPNLQVFHERLGTALAGADIDWEWVVVDDHSRDATFAAACALVRADKRVRAFRLARNVGPHAAGPVQLLWMTCRITELLLACRRPFCAIAAPRSGQSARKQEKQSHAGRSRDGASDNDHLFLLPPKISRTCSPSRQQISGLASARP
jgi:glycosyltransferase involved in cell wall biosynthesis